MRIYSMGKREDDGMGVRERAVNLTDVPVLWSAERFDARFNVTRMVKNHRRAGVLLPADVLVGFGSNPQAQLMFGWSRQRVEAYGRLIGYLDVDGNVRPRPVNQRIILPDELPDWWNIETVTYASIADVAMAWGISVQAARMRSARGRLGSPDVIIHNGRYPRPGFLPETVAREGAREGFTHVSAPWIPTT